jgi:transcriptional regulator with XRE-family HTH domain
MGDKDIGRKFKQAREKKKLTQAEVAEKAGLNVNYYARIERGDYPGGREALRSIAKVLGIKNLNIL